MSVVPAWATLCRADRDHSLFAHMPPESDTVCCFGVSRQLLRFSTLVVALADVVGDECNKEADVLELVRAATCAPRRGPVIAEPLPKAKPVAAPPPKPPRISREHHPALKHAAVAALKYEDDQWTFLEARAPPQ